MTDTEMRRRIDTAFEFLRRVAEHPDRFPDQAVLFLMDPGEIASAITKERLRVLRELEAREPPPRSTDGLGHLHPALHREGAPHSSNRDPSRTDPGRLPRWITDTVGGIIERWGGDRTRSGRIELSELALPGASGEDGASPPSGDS